MSIINEIREIQAKTVADHEEKLRRDNNVCEAVVHEIHEKIKQRMTDYYFAKNKTDETFEFIQKNMINNEYYTVKISDKEHEITIPEYQKIMEILLDEGFKISQKTVMSERTRFKPVKELKLEW